MGGAGLLGLDEAVFGVSPVGFGHRGAEKKMFWRDAQNYRRGACAPKKRLAASARDGQKGGGGVFESSDDGQERGGGRWKMVGGGRKAETGDLKAELADAEQQTLDTEPRT